MTIKTYSARELRDSHFLTDDSVSVITSHGRPVKVAIPFDERMFGEGISRALALNLVENHVITQVQGAKMAEVSLESFLNLMAKFGIPAADMNANELVDDLKEFL